MNLKIPKYSTLLCLFSLAFLFRLSMLFYAPAPKHFEKYLILGQQLLETGLIAERPFSYSPLYCYFIAINKAIFGDFTTGILLAQIFLGSLSCLFLFMVVEHLCGSKSAWVSFVMVCCYHSFVLYEITFLSDFLGLFLSVFLVWSLYWIWGKKGVSSWLLPGILLGFAVLQRSNYLLLALLILPLAYFQGKSFSLFIKRAALLLSSMCMILFPVILQNIWLIGEPGITVTNPGYIFYSSNNYKNVGVLYHPPHVLLQREKVSEENRRLGKEPSRYLSPFQGDAELSRDISSIITGEKMNLEESSRFYMKYAFRYLLTYPKEAILLFLQKFWFLFHGKESHDVISVMMHAPLVKPFTPFAYWWIVPLGIIGFFFSLKEWRKWIPVYLILFHQSFFMILFYVVSRFRLPIEAVIIVFASFALKNLCLLIQKRKIKSFLSISAVAILLLFLCNTMNANMKEHDRETYLDSQFSMAIYAIKEKKFSEAFHHFQAVLALEDPYSQRAIDCHRNQSLLYSHLKMHEHSQKEWKRANLSLGEIIKGLENHRSQGKITFHQKLGLASLYKLQNKMQEAELLLKEAVLQKPSRPDARYELAFLQFQSNNFIEAQKNFEIAIQDGLLFSQESLMACFLLGQIYEKQNQPGKAKKWYEQALRQKDIIIWYGLDEEAKAILEKLSKKEWR